MQDEVSLFLEHGERRFFRAGCRCEECAGAERAYQRGRRPPGPRTEPVALTSVPAPGDWIRNARCKSAPVNLFFPLRGEDNATAKAICAGCPVLNDCRDYALANPDSLRGIWGGLTARERRRSRHGRLSA